MASVTAVDIHSMRVSELWQCWTAQWPAHRSRVSIRQCAAGLWAVCADGCVGEADRLPGLSPVQTHYDWSGADIGSATHLKRKSHLYTLLSISVKSMWTSAGSIILSGNGVGFDTDVGLKSVWLSAALVNPESSVWINQALDTKHKLSQPQEWQHRRRADWQG